MQTQSQKKPNVLDSKSKFNQLPPEVIVNLAIMLGADFHTLLTSNKSCREVVIEDPIGIKYFNFISRLIKHFHYSREGLNHFLREVHEDPKEKIKRQIHEATKAKEKKQSDNNNPAIESKEVVLPALSKKHLDPEDAYDFHATYQLSQELRTSLYDCENHHSGLIYNIDERIFHGRDYIVCLEQMDAIIRLIKRGSSAPQAVERIRGFTDIQAQGISFGLTDKEVKQLTPTQLKFLVDIVNKSDLRTVILQLTAFPHLDDQVSLEAMYAVWKLDQGYIAEAYQQVTQMSQEQKLSKINQYKRQRHDAMHGLNFFSFIGGTFNGFPQNHANHVTEVAPQRQPAPVSLAGFVPGIDDLSFDAQTPLLQQAIAILAQGEQRDITVRTISQIRPPEQKAREEKSNNNPSAPRQPGLFNSSLTTYTVLPARQPAVNDRQDAMGESDVSYTRLDGDEASQRDSNACCCRIC